MRCVPALACLLAAAFVAAAPLSIRPASGQAPAYEVPDWRDGGVCYEVFVRSFYDSDGDGVGDLEGLTQKLDYINDGDPDTRGDLGADCIWLMPVAVSPSYHGYDVTNYYRIDPSYGSNEDFKRLIEAAHRRGIRVLVDMVINHTSDEHPRFKHALLYRDSPYRDWYRWSEVPGPDNEYGDNNWHRSPVRDEYYYGFFSPRMPDLNWETPAVREEMKQVATFWLEEMGADGFRLDAVRHLVEDDEGASTNVPRTHDMLREYAAHIHAVDPDAFTIGEVFDSTGALLAYYPDQLDSYFGSSTTVKRSGWPVTSPTHVCVRPCTGASARPPALPRVCHGSRWVRIRSPRTSRRWTVTPALCSTSTGSSSTCALRIQRLDQASWFRSPRPNRPWPRF
ncbi:MAG: alpha-amylase family glycosyl hydrolase [Gemmatimonadales bacterium]